MLSVQWQHLGQVQSPQAGTEARAGDDFPGWIWLEDLWGCKLMTIVSGATAQHPEEQRNRADHGHKGGASVDLTVLDSEFLRSVVWRGQLRVNTAVRFSNQKRT